MRVRMNVRNSGYFIDGDGVPHDWPKAGGVIDLPDSAAAHEIEAGHAVEAADAELGEPAVEEDADAEPEPGPDATPAEASPAPAEADDRPTGRGNRKR